MYMHAFHPVNFLSRFELFNFFVVAFKFHKFWPKFVIHNHSSLTKLHQNLFSLFMKIYCNVIFQELVGLFINNSKLSELNPNGTFLLCNLHV